jgi:hypothetical protein
MLLLLGLGACSWVSDADFEERLTQVDNDADGVPAAEDCDDLNPAISPAVIEIWYDGIDQRCDGGDDYDQDGDGYVQNAYIGLVTAGVAGTGALPGNDCDDLAPRVSPNETDSWYDGVDQDCDGADDYDQDEDGYVEDDHVGLPTTYAAGTGVLPGRDCDDLAPAVNPEGDDLWYDGEDTDCGGEDDWDQDVDGFIDPAMYADYGPTTYAPGTGNLANGDCDDTDALVSPAAFDEWYDGDDSDCAGDDDYDQDLDGYADPRGGGLDCDDGDAAIHPDARESLGDRDDSDCDGGVDSFLLAPIEGFTWSGVHSPVFDESSDTIYLSVAAAQIDTGATVYHDSALALRWSNADPGDGQDGVAAWSASTTDPSDYTIGRGQGFIASDDYLYGVVSLDYGDTRALRLVRYEVATGTRFAANANGSDGLSGFDDVSIALDADGALHAVACEDATEVLQYVRVPSSFSGGFAADEEIAGVGAADCAIDLHAPTGHIFTSERGGVWDYTFDVASSTPTFAGSAYSMSYAPLDLDIPAAWSDSVLVMADATTDSVVLLDAVSAATIGAGDVPVEVDVFQDTGGTLYIGYITAGGDARLTFGTVADGFTERELPTPFAVQDVSVWVSGGYLMYAVVGVNDVAVGIARL